MTTFYQSSLRRTIQESLYKKPIFEYTFAGKQYRGTIKQMRVLGKETRRSMMHGIQLPDIQHYNERFQQDLVNYKRDHGGQKDIFLQLGFDLPIAEYPTAESDQYLGTTLEKITYTQRDFLSWYDLRPTCREHMPHATIMLDTQGNMEERKKSCSTSGKRMLNKGQKAGLEFKIASTEKERRAFWQLRYAMSYDKGFAVLPEEQFITLMNWLTEQGTGWLFVAQKDESIVSGSVCVGWEKTMVYLYGATDRAWGNIGAHYRLTLHIRGRARDQHYTAFDLLGIAPPGSDETHHLAGVTRFKESFGGRTVVVAGSYDLVCSPRGYRAFKARRSIKK